MNSSLGIVNTTPQITSKGVPLEQLNKYTVKQMKIGIVLSGGGIRGIAHLGVLKALSSAGITFSKICGASAGSIVGALFAQGVDPYEILELFLKTRLFKYIRPSIGVSGLLSLKNTTSLFKEYFPHDSFSELKIPLVIAVTNFSQGKLVYLSSGKLIEAIQASCAIPGVFKPIIINNEMYIDGGVLNNFPVEPLVDDCDFIIGSSCNYIPVVDKITNFRKMAERAAMISIGADIDMKSKLCDVFIEPKEMGETSVFDVKKAEEIYWIAYEETLKQLKTDKKLIEIVNKIKASAKTDKAVVK